MRGFDDEHIEALAALKGTSLERVLELTTRMPWAADIDGEPRGSTAWALHVVGQSCWDAYAAAGLSASQTLPASTAGLQHAVTAALSLDATTRDEPLGAATGWSTIAADVMSARDRGPEHPVLRACQLLMEQPQLADAALAGGGWDFSIAVDLAANRSNTDLLGALGLVGLRAWLVHVELGHAVPSLQPSAFAFAEATRAAVAFVVDPGHIWPSALA